MNRITREQEYYYSHKLEKYKHPHSTQSLLDRISLSQSNLSLHRIPYSIQQHAHDAVPDALLELQEAVERRGEFGAARLPEVDPRADVLEAVHLDAHLT